MVSQSNPEKVNAYLVKNNLLDVFIFLVVSADNLRCRGNLLGKNLADLSQGLQKLVQRISENPNISHYDKEVSQLFKELHYLELESIQRICIFIELLAVYYHIMRKNVKDIPRAISAHDIDSSKLYPEFEYFRNQSVEDIRKNFKFPNVNNFSELSIEEKQRLNEFLQDSAQMTLDFFKEVYHFNSCFRPIYNKYKHVMSEFTGVYGIDKERQDIQSHVYVRQKDIDIRKYPHYSVFMIPLSTDAIQYFDRIARSVWTLLMFLVDNQLLLFANEGKDFIPRNLLMPEKWKNQEIEQLTGKIKSYCMPDIQSILKVNPPTDAELQNKINQSFKTDHLYVMKKDILDVDFLKYSEIERFDASKLARNNQKSELVEIVDIASSNEVWSTYRLVDGTILKIREVLVKAIKLPRFDDKGNPIYNLRTQTVSVAFPPKSILGKETAVCTQEELSKSVIDSNMKFDLIQEPWNEYVLNDGTNLRIKAVLETVSKTSKYEHHGEPIYLTSRLLCFEVNSSRHSNQ